MGFNVTIRNAMLDWFFGNLASGYANPTDFYVALIKDDTLEVSGGNYARVQTDVNDWNLAASGAVTNLTAVTFPAPTADWGLIAQFKLYDQAVGGTELLVGDLVQSINVLSGGTTPEFLAGNLSVTIT